MCRIRRELTWRWFSAALVAAACVVVVRGQVTRPEAAEKEVQEIKTALEAALSDFASPKEVMPGGLDFESTLQKVSAVAARVDLFEMRFGVVPAKVRGWDSIASTARRRLKLTKTQEDGSRLYFAGDSLGVTLGILLELSGKPDDALELLRGAEPGGTSGNWKATVWLVVHTRESAILQARGDFAEALAAHEKALKRLRLALHSKNLPELFCRYGYLLEKNGRQADAFVQYQRVVDLFPGTAASELCAKRLKDAGKLVSPSAATLKTRLSGPDRSDALLALGAHRFPESYAVLVDALAATKGGWDYRTILEALVALRDPKAVTVLSGEIGRAEPSEIGDILVALWKLGDKSQVIPGLTRMKTAVFVRAEALHPVLEEIYGGAPKIDLDEAQGRPVKFADAWLGFIQSRGSDSRPDSRR